MPFHSIAVSALRRARVRRNLAQVRWRLVAACSGGCDEMLAGQLLREAEAISWGTCTP